MLLQLGAAALLLRGGYAQQAALRHYREPRKYSLTATLKKYSPSVSLTEPLIIGYETKLGSGVSIRGGWLFECRLPHPRNEAHDIYVASNRCRAAYSFTTRAVGIFSERRGCVADCGVLVQGIAIDTDHTVRETTAWDATDSDNDDDLH
eukprot:1192929-Prorocentrum_minimum.AAC.1